MTRRILKPQPTENEHRKIGVIDQRHGENDGLYYTWLDREAEGKSKVSDDYNPDTWKCPYGTIGDRLWVREAFACRFGIIPDRYIEKYFYRADGEHEGKLKWKPSIHMPRSASRITLEITKIRVERLNEISEDDAKNEGVLYYGDESGDYKNYEYDDKEGDDWGVKTAKESFQTLWESINGKGSWEANPWVWVIEFKRKA